MTTEVVVITGGSAGVGRATAREFAKRGASIGLLARDPARLETAAGEVRALGGRAVACVCDVAFPAQVDAAADRVERALGPIDVWINNAMASVFSRVRDLRPEELHRVTAVTYWGTVHGTMAALERMLPRDRGTILQVGSALAHRSIPLQSAYCAAKHAVTGFTESTTVLAILADELVPGIADRYLATTAHEAQQSEVPADPDRPDNLFAPVPGDFAAHGEFEAIAKRHSVQFWMVRHRAALAALALAAGGTWVALRRAASGRGRERELSA